MVGHLDSAFPLSGLPSPKATTLARNDKGIAGTIGSWSRSCSEKSFLKEFFAELLGEFLLLYFGFASHAALRLRWSELREDSFIISIAFGAGALVAISASLEVSGGHLNPAITTALASIGRFPLKKICHYVVAQHLGGFLAAFVLWVVFREGLEAFEASLRAEKIDEERIFRQMASFFTTFPFRQTLQNQEPFQVSLHAGFIDQVVSTAVLVFALFAVEGSGLSRKLLPMTNALVLTGVIMTSLYNASAVLNPARDLPPRLFAMILYGPRVFEPQNYSFFWLTAIIAPHIGGIVGAWLYVLLINPTFIGPVKNKPIHAPDVV